MATKRSKAGTTSAFDTHYETERHFKNVHYGEKLPSEPISEEEIAKRKQTLKDHIKSFVDAIVNQYPPETLSKTGDFSAYSGSCGVAFMFFRLYERIQHSNTNDASTADYYLAMTRKYAEISIQMYTPSKRKPLLTFWCGGPGPFALMAILHKMNKEEQKVKEYVGKILEFMKWVHDDSFESDELLYGRAGLLYSLMYLNKYLKDDSIHAACIEIAKAILKRGKLLESQSPLMYEWHERRYLAGAHGLSGILYLLLDLKEIMNDEQYKNDIIGSIDFLASQELPSGNYPTREEGTSDELVQWCHGATAILMLYCKAEKLLKETKWRKHAERAANCIWKRGLLKKGVGLCHGISGNGYALLSMYNLTQDPMYYEQAWKFCEFSWSEKGAITYSKPDEPYCLANGLAGAVTFYLDMLDPPSSNWIGFDL